VNPYDKIISKMKELEKIWNKLEKSNRNDLMMYPLDDKIVVKIRDLRQLPIASRLIKNVIPNWSYELRNVWSALGNGLAAWTDPDNQLVEIWLDMPLHVFPLDKIKPGCEFKTITISKCQLVCDNDE